MHGWSLIELKFNTARFIPHLKSALFFRALTVLLSELICFCLEVDLTTRDVMNVQGKPNRDRQKLVREQDILKQVCLSYFLLFIEFMELLLTPVALLAVPVLSKLKILPVRCSNYLKLRSTKRHQWSCFSTRSGLLSVPFAVCVTAWSKYPNSRIVKTRLAFLSKNISN